MKNRIFVLILSILFSVNLVAQSISTTDHESVDASRIEQLSGFSSVTEASRLANEIVKAAGLRANFEVRTAKIPNAAAVIHGGKRYILYNPDFIDRLSRVTGTRWSAISVLAHEIGHHLNARSRSGTVPQLATELEADEFSGYVLRKLGATLPEAQVAMQALGNVRGSSTHPPRAYRLNSIAEGWNSAGGPTETNSGMAANKPRVVVPEQQPVLDNKYILATITFTADPHAQYFVTTRYNVVKVSDNKLFMVGKMTRLSSNQFPYLIYDGEDNRVFVDAKGGIVNSKGGNVGRLSVQRS
jgi:hypothetical protein